MSVHSPIVNLHLTQKVMRNFIIKITRRSQPLNNIPGMGRFTIAALKRYGIQTVEQFSIFTEDEITALLGKSGVKLLRNAKQLSYA